MFKNLTVFRLPPNWYTPIEIDEDRLDTARFVPCGATQDKAVGWVPPRGEEHGALVESVAGQRVMKLLIQTKSVPGGLVREKADEAASNIEDQTGRKPGKKQMKELREDALLTLLPQAFPRTSSVLVWVDLVAGLLVTDAVGGSKLDAVVTALVRAFTGLSQLRYIQTNAAPQTAMTQWLNQDPEYWPAGFNVERECELKSLDEEKSVVKFNRHNLATDEIRKHISEGKLPTRLALSYDGRVSFVLTDAMQLKKIKLLDLPDADETDAFDADVALTTGELQKLIPALIEALGGEMKTDNLFGE